MHCLSILLNGPQTRCRSQLPVDWSCAVLAAGEVVPGLFSLSHSALPLDFLLSSKPLRPLSASGFFILSAGMCVLSVFACFGMLRCFAFMVEDDITACSDHRSRLSPEAALRWHLQVRLPPATSASGSAEHFWYVLILLGHCQVASLVGFRILNSHLKHLAKDTLKGENKWVVRFNEIHRHWAE